MIYLKADAPTIEKKVWNHGDGDWDDWTDVNIGDTVKFKHESNLPEMEGYDWYWFIVHDSMSAGLTLKMGSFDIYVGGDTTPLVRGTSRIGAYQTGAYADFENENCDYIVMNSYPYTCSTPPNTEYSGLGVTNFAIIFNPALFVDYPTHYGPHAKIEITYEAELNDEAVIAVSNTPNKYNPNKVYLEYSNNPYETGSSWTPGGETGATTEDEVWVYTFELDLYKFTGPGGSDAGDLGTTPVPGATFNLYQGGAITAGEYDGGTLVKFVLVTSPVLSTDPVVYRVALESEPGNAVMTAPASGKISIIGLDADVYYLEETSTPSPYNLDTKYYEVVIANESVNSSTKVVVYTINTYVPTGQGAIPADINIFNGSDSGKLPETGGFGRSLFISIGILLTVSAHVTLSVRRKVRRMWLFM